MGEGSAAVLAALLAGLGGLLVPATIARLPEPRAVAPVEPGLDGSDTAAKTPYAQLATTPRLAAWCALVAGVAGAAVGWRLGWSPVLPVWIFLCIVGVLLGFVDWRTRLLPTAVIGPSYAVVAVLLTAAAVAARDWDSATRALLGWAVTGGLFLLLWFVHPRGMGYGDVRLAGVLGLALGWLGWAELATGIYAAFCLGALVGGVLAVAKVVDRRHYPFGPFLLIGALIGVVWGPLLAAWYAGA